MKNEIIKKLENDYSNLIKDLSLLIKYFKQESEIDKKFDILSELSKYNHILSKHYFDIDNPSSFPIYYFDNIFLKNHKVFYEAFKYLIINKNNELIENFNIDEFIELIHYFFETIIKNKSIHPSYEYLCEYLLSFAGINYSYIEFKKKHKKQEIISKVINHFKQKIVEKNITGLTLIDDSY